jgi:hypothetical protein
LLLVFVAYYANVTFFTHSHVVNGTTIVHSHFHNTSHTETGNHSTSELTLIAALSLFQTTAAAVGYVAIVLMVLLAAIVPHVRPQKIYCRYSALLPLRAPPAR